MREDSINPLLNLTPQSAFTYSMDEECEGSEACLKILGKATSPLIFNATGDSLDQNDIAVWCDYTGQKEDNVQNWGWLVAVHHVVPGYTGAECLAHAVQASAYGR
jgi:hypothetical protein